MARERGLIVDHSEFEEEMNAQKQRPGAHKSTDILVSEDSDSDKATFFCGYKLSNLSEFEAICTDLIDQDEDCFLVFDQTPFYAEMGGQVADVFQPVKEIPEGRKYD